jgi:ribonucleoside-diphosphate reductase alpha chain
MDPKATIEGLGAAKGRTGKSRAKKAERILGGTWGASFLGTNPNGSRVTGLAWPRRFTTAGVHPYDEIEWELRTANIASETGKTVFEQTDVEVPKFWSQLATNVVVSKYFRGHVGTPERERSVRQLIDRVVNTITAWAETQRYFATDEDLRAFKDELTHLLVHQKMAFNSPVWFNVGIEPKPQCSACQPYDALVSTPEGMVPIGRLVDENAVGREVYDAHGLTRVVAVKNNGFKPVYRVRLANGNFVEATPDHVVKAVRQRRSAPEWLRVDQLEVGMRMHEHAHGAVVRERELVAVSVSGPATKLDNRSIEAAPPVEAEIIAIENVGFQEVFDIQTESGEYLTNNVAVHNCFINSVQDNMGSIMDLAKTEAMLFKFGSGAGSNLSPIRSSKERMSGGGMASGPVSFMKGYDAFAGVIKSGGKTRRAAKMVILDADHPDVLEFVDSKMLEEKKAWALIEQGYDPSFTGEAYASVYFQNANHSVRVTDEFMRAVESDALWTTHAIRTKEPVEQLRAREIFRRMADAAWVCGDPGIQYDTTINDWHTSAVTDRIYASNPCSEYMFLNDTACNLASLNLMKFVKADGEFDVEAYRYAARLTITAQEILVDNASYPTPRIEENSHKFRPLGLGYANLGALLMSRGLAYDSDEGRNFAAALTAIMHGEAYRQSSVVARDHGGPFLKYDENRAPFLRVIGKHRDAAYQIDEEGVPADVLEASRKVFDEALELGREHGYRNAQVTVLAPTGTIAFMMDCDTTGIEPDIALIKYKKLVGEGFLKIVNQTVPQALRRLGYSADEVAAILDYLNDRETIEGAPGLKPEHLSVFDCAFKPKNGERSIHYMGHVRMMGAVQPFISGAISKTVNMPEAATADEIEQVYLEGWKRGLKAIAIYRDNSKRSQPLMAGKKTDEGSAEQQKAIAELKTALAAAQTEAGKPHRRRLPAERTAVTHKFEIAGHEGYITVGLYPDGQPGEIFLKMAKEGSTVSGLMDTFATTVSVALQYGVPLRDLVNKFAHVRFEPSGFTGNPEIPIAKSTVDYIFRWLGSRFMSADDKANLGLIDRAVVESPADGPASGSVDAAGPASSGPFDLAARSGDSRDDAVRAHASVDPAPAAPTSAAFEHPSVAVAPTPTKSEGEELAILANGAKSNGHAANGNGKATNGGGVTLNLGGTKVAFATQADAPSCMDCGSIMVRNGSCYKCLNCGSTSGCS